MSTEFKELQSESQNQIRSASDLVRRFLQADPSVHQRCAELGYQWRECIYIPMITVWLFVTQVISADKSCQTAVGRLNAWRVTRGLNKVSQKTTAFCNARGRLPEALFERLLLHVAKACEQATDEAWL